MMGVQLLSQLVCEMNQISEADASRSLTKHRKIASSFRDSQLFEIFQLSSTLLRTGTKKVCVWSTVTLFSSQLLRTRTISTSTTPPSTV